MRKVVGCQAELTTTSQQLVALEVVSSVRMRVREREREREAAARQHVLTFVAALVNARGRT